MVAPLLLFQAVCPRRVVTGRTTSVLRNGGARVPTVGDAVFATSVIA